MFSGSCVCLVVAVYVSVGVAHLIFEKLWWCKFGDFTISVCLSRVVTWIGSYRWDICGIKL